MSRIQTIPARGRSESLIATHRVLRNTYALLSLTLLFSALCAAASMMLELPYPGFVVTLVGYFGLFFWSTNSRIAPGVSSGYLR